MNIPQKSEGHGCIFHWDTFAIKIFHVKDTHTGQWFQYGLCVPCTHKLNTQDSFKKLINERLEELTTKMEEKQREETCKFNRQ